MNELEVLWKDLEDADSFGDEVTAKEIMRRIEALESFEGGRVTESAYKTPKARRVDQAREAGPGTPGGAATAARAAIPVTP